jgi:hypothetical protein
VSFDLFPCYEGSFANSFLVGSAGTSVAAGSTICADYLCFAGDTTDNLFTWVQYLDKVNLLSYSSWKISTIRKIASLVKEKCSQYYKGSLLVEWFVLTKCVHNIYIRSITNIQYEA